MTGSRGVSVALDAGAGGRRDRAPLVAAANAGPGDAQARGRALRRGSPHPARARRRALTRPCSARVEAVHRDRRAIGEERLDGLRRAVEVTAQLLLLVGRESAPARSSPCPSARSAARSRSGAAARRACRASRGCRRGPLWPPPLPDARRRSLPNGRSGVVEDHEQIARGVLDGELAERGRHGVARHVHEGLGLEHADVHAAERRHAPAREAALEAARGRVEPPAIRAGARSRGSPRCAGCARSAAPGLPSPTTSFKSYSSRPWPEPRRLRPPPPRPRPAAASAGLVSSSACGSTTDATARSGSERRRRALGQHEIADVDRVADGRGFDTSTTTWSGIARGRHSISTSRSGWSRRTAVLDAASPCRRRGAARCTWIVCWRSTWLRSACRYAPPTGWRWISQHEHERSRSCRS